MGLTINHYRVLQASFKNWKVWDRQIIQLKLYKASGYSVKLNLGHLLKGQKPLFET